MRDLWHLSATSVRALALGKQLDSLGEAGLRSHPLPFLLRHDYNVIIVDGAIKVRGRESLDEPPNDFAEERLPTKRATTEAIKVRDRS